jgi:2TM domain
MKDVIGGRDAALQRQRAERAFEAHVATYLAVNAMLAGVRAVLGARPVWPVRTMFWWGIGLAFHGWSLRRETIAEAESRDKVADLTGSERQTLR